MAESTADVITIENEESENLVELYKSKFDYCSEFFLLKKAFKTKDKNGP